MVDFGDIKGGIKQLGGYASGILAPYIVHSVPNEWKLPVTIATLIPTIAGTAYSIRENNDFFINQNEHGLGRFRKIARLAGGMTTSAIGAYAGLNYGLDYGLLGQVIGLGIGSYGDKIIRGLQVLAYPELRAVERYLTEETGEPVKIGILDAFNLRRSFARTYVELAERTGANVNLEALLNYIAMDRYGVQDNEGHGGAQQPAAQPQAGQPSLLSKIGSFISYGLPSSAGKGLAGPF